MANAVYKGTLKTWKDDRGFGFIKPDNGDKDIFVHISSLKGLRRRPNRGDTLYYEIVKEADGKLKAINVRTELEHATPSLHKFSKRWLWLAALSLGLISITVAAYYNP